MGRQNLEAAMRATPELGPRLEALENTLSGVIGLLEPHAPPLRAPGPPQDVDLALQVRILQHALDEVRSMLGPK